MSDFDREAEREKLREKFERDKQKREASEQMSQLLLQGATMTNQHCKECHSPIFRYEGREFCPTCQKEVDESGEFIRDVQTEGDDRQADESANRQPAAGGQQAEPADDKDSAPGEQTVGADTREPTADRGQPADTEQSSTEADVQGEEPTAEESTETRPTPAPDRRPARVDPPARREDPSAEATGGDLAAAEAALVREITALTRQAEETRDVGRERDLLAAAREAAETLQEVRRL